VARDPTSEPVQPVSELVRRAAAEVVRILSRDGIGSGVTVGGPAQPVNGPGFSVPIGVSNRHAHLSPGDLAALFGPGYELTPRNELGQPGQYAAEETVALVGPAGEIREVRILGPPRPRTQVEILGGDTYELGLPYDTPVGSAMPITFVGPVGRVELVDGAVVAQRHLHVPPADAERYGLKDGITVAAEAGAPGRRVLFKDVKVRVSPTAGLELHLDREEAAGCGARSGDSAFVLTGGVSMPSGGKRAFRTEKPGLLTEADVVEAFKAGIIPSVKGVIVTPYARDALRKYFPELLVE
jgi:putative phosphotransacetylase